jgi:CubicO group peptidase (beta-lactamase class C family)
MASTEDGIISIPASIRSIRRWNRAVGIVIAGADGKANLRGFGRMNSAEGFGHPGFGGQIGWADPATEISFGYLTNGYDRNDLREGRRSVAVCSLAGACRD